VFSAVTLRTSWICAAAAVAVFIGFASPSRSSRVATSAARPATWAGRIEINWKQDHSHSQGGLTETGHTEYHETLTLQINGTSTTKASGSTSDERATTEVDDKSVCTSEERTFTGQWSGIPQPGALGGRWLLAPYDDMNHAGPGLLGTDKAGKAWAAVDLAVAGKSPASSSLFELSVPHIIGGGECNETVTTSDGSTTNSFAFGPGGNGVGGTIAPGTLHDNPLTGVQVIRTTGKWRSSPPPFTGSATQSYVDANPVDRSPLPEWTSTYTISWNLEPFCELFGTVSGQKPWVAFYPDSKRPEDLHAPFRGNVNDFIHALEAAGATVTVETTYRPDERAWLMHQSSKIARGASIPPPDYPHGFDQVPICWEHRRSNGSVDTHASRAAATAMTTKKGGYNIAFPPAYPSRHTLHLAIDMKITWEHNPLVLHPPRHRPIMIHGSCPALCSGATNHELWAAGHRYWHVQKLAADPPHWSDNGH
jgi:hypothetical protein